MVSAICTRSPGMSHFRLVIMSIGCGAAMPPSSAARKRKAAPPSKWKPDYHHDKATITTSTTACKANYQVCQLFNHLRVWKLTISLQEIMATIVIGAQWGDEVRDPSKLPIGLPICRIMLIELLQGKGKLVDILCPTVKLCARAQGGNNAGHTIVANGITCSSSESRLVCCLFLTSI
jgi:hypothetical protein